MGALQFIVTVPVLLVGPQDAGIGGFRCIATESVLQISGVDGRMTRVELSRKPINSARAESTNESSQLPHKMENIFFAMIRPKLPNKSIESRTVVKVLMTCQEIAFIVRPPGLASFGRVFCSWLSKLVV